MPRAVYVLGSALALSLLVAGCTDQANPPTSPRPNAQPSAGRGPMPTDPTATWRIPLSDGELGLRSDHQFSDGTSSVYTDGVCKVATHIFATTQSSNSGDATLNTSMTMGSCVRRFTIAYPDNVSESVGSFMNLNILENTGYSIPVGQTAKRRLIVSPQTINSNPSRCGRLLFGEKDGNFLGSDSLWVTRVDARTWRVYSQDAPRDNAYCESNGQTYEIRVDLTIVSSAALP